MTSINFLIHNLSQYIIFEYMTYYIWPYNDTYSYKRHTIFDCSVKPGPLRSQAPRPPIQVLTTIPIAYLRKKANHSTSVAIKAGFHSLHSEAVEVIYINNRYISPPLSWRRPEVTHASLGKSEGRAYATH